MRTVIVELYFAREEPYCGVLPGELMDSFCIEVAENEGVSTRVREARDAWAAQNGWQVNEIELSYVDRI